MESIQSQRAFDLGKSFQLGRPLAIAASAGLSQPHSFGEAWRGFGSLMSISFQNLGASFLGVLVIRALLLWPSIYRALIWKFPKISGLASE